MWGSQQISSKRINRLYERWGGGGRGDVEADRNGRSQLSARYRAIHINASSFDGREGRSGTYFNF